MTDITNTLPSEELGSVPTNEDKKKGEPSEDESKNMTAKSSAILSEGQQVGKDVAEDESLQDSCRDMFKKISEYLQSELTASQEDYELLEKLNELTKLKYNEMDNVTNALLGRMKGINEKYANLEPFLSMIDKVDASVSSLEQAAYKLDAYSKELEARFKKLEKAASI